MSDETRCAMCGCPNDRSRAGWANIEDIREMIDVPPPEDCSPSFKDGWLMACKMLESRVDGFVDDGTISDLVAEKNELEMWKKHQLGMTKP